MKRVFHGVVQNGRIDLDSVVSIPEGTEVVVIPRSRLGSTAWKMLQILATTEPVEPDAAAELEALIEERPGEPARKVPQF